MEFLLEKKETIKIKGISHIMDSKCSLEHYNQENKSLSGKIKLHLEYFVNSVDLIQNGDFTFDFFIAYEALVTEIQVDKVHLDVIDNQGLEMEYTLIISSTEVNVIEDIKQEIMEEASNDLEAILDLEERNIDDSIIESFSAIKEDNVIPANDSFDLMPPLLESFQSYKVFYISDEKEIEVISEKYKKDISTIYEENNFNLGKKIIIKVNE